MRRNQRQKYNPEATKKLLSRDSLNLTGVSRECGIAKSTLYLLKDGKIPEITTLEKLCEYFKLDIGYFFADKVSFIEHTKAS